jgi:hypothetical protein
VVFLTIAGWLSVIVLAALTVLTAAQRSYAGTTAAVLLACLLACLLGVVGVLPGVAAVGIATALALAAVVMVAETPRDEHGKRDYARAVGDAAGRVLRAARDGRVWLRRTRAVLDRERARPADDLAPYRERRSLPLAAPDGMPPPLAAVPPPPPPPSTNGRKEPMTTPPPADAGPGAGSGTVADIFIALQTAIMRGKSEGMPGNHRTVKLLAEIDDYLSQVKHSFATYMADVPNYSPAIWEPLTAAAAHSRASAGATGQSDTALTALARMTVGDVAANPAVRAPHHSELNAAR